MVTVRQGGTHVDELVAMARRHVEVDLPLGAAVDGDRGDPVAGVARREQRDARALESKTPPLNSSKRKGGN